MAKVELKQPIVAEISENIKDAQSVVLVDYRGLTVEQDTELRKQLRAEGITYKVYKNTMMNFAFKEQTARRFLPIWKAPVQLLFLQRMQQRRQEYWLNLQKQLMRLKSKAVLWKGLLMTRKELQISQ